jgi:hypothetical protein
MITVREISSIPAFEDVESTWEEILGGRDSSPFLTHAFARCCLDGYLPGRTPALLVAEDGSGTAGFAPLWRGRERVRGVDARTISFIASPEAPQGDFVIREGAEEKVLNAFFQHLFSEGKHPWDVMKLGPFRRKSPTFAASVALLRRFGRRYTTWIEHVPFLDIAGTWEEFLKAKPQRFRKTYRNINNRIGKLGRAEVLRFEEGRSEEILGRAVTVSERSWKRSAGLSLSGSGETMRFFTSLTGTALSRGWLLVWILEIDGRPVAMEYDLKRGGEVHALQAAFDKDFADHSPGVFLQNFILRTLYEEGWDRYSFGGGLAGYKSHLTGSVEENVTLNVYNGTPRGTFLWLFERLVPLLKGVRKPFLKGSRSGDGTP